ncbi:response regulator transcription factor [Bacillaceae bacterium S4-13-56]
MKTILLIEDEITISRVLSAYLKKAGFNVEQVYEGSQAKEKFLTIRPSLVLLDVMLPGKDGWTILKEIREISSCPVIMLTALGEIDQKLTGLHQGADDYITKPFVAEEVVARIQAVLRRSSFVADEKGIIYFGGLKLNEKSHTVSLHGKTINVTPKDLSLLFFLAKHPNQTFTRDQLIEHVWGLDYDGSDRAVDLAIKRIRKALEDWPESEGEIKTIRGLGYQMSVY